jgi:hypothetical protein
LVTNEDDGSMDANSDAAKAPVFISDDELRERWKCSAMKLHRMRRDGRLARPIKPGGGGKNLNYLSHILEVEAAS